ncbi:MAG TPA: ParA family partition ATPase [Stenomitos sp.]
MIIAFQSQKGGCGKTTLALHVAHCLSLRDGPLLLVDADPQGSARDWAAARQDPLPFSVVGLDRPTIHRDLPDISKNYAHVIIDGPPRTTDLARSAIAAADLVIIPVQPSPLDVWATAAVIDLIKECSVFKENLKSAFLVNRKIVNTAIGRDVTEALAGYGLPVMKAKICQRVAFAECIASGQSVLETDPNGQAAKEIKSLTNELLELSKNA